MKKAIALLLALVTLLSLTACAGKEDAASSALDQIKQKGELVVGTSADYPPYEPRATTLPWHCILTTARKRKLMVGFAR